MVLEKLLKNEKNFLLDFGMLNHLQYLENENVVKFLNKYTEIGLISPRYYYDIFTQSRKMD